jgi:Domain of unknown function (DUF4265)
MLKLIFEIEAKNEWPPVEAESLWFDEFDHEFRLKSILFFIEGIAYNDILDVEILSDAGGVITSVVRSSGNSTIWA